MENAVLNGAQAIDVNIESVYVLEAFKRIKGKYPNIIGIGDPNMNAGFYMDGVPIKKYEKEIIRYIFDFCLTPQDKSLFIRKSGEYKENFFNLSSCDALFVRENINRISLDENRWMQRIVQLSSCCEFCLFGADYADWLTAIGRFDLLKYQADSIVACGMMPISISHWSGLTIPQLDRIQSVKYHCVLANEDCILTEPDDIYGLIKDSSSTFIGFRTMRGLGRYFSIDNAFNFMTKKLGLSHFIVGASTTPDVTGRLFYGIKSWLIENNLFERYDE